MLVGLAAVSVWPTGVTFAQTYAQSAVAALLPQGEKAGLTKTFVVGDHTYAVVTSKTTPEEDRPWLVIGEKTSAGWHPLYATLTLPAWQASVIAVGPQNGNEGTVTVSFIVDAATGLISNVYNLVLQRSSVRLVAVWPDLVNMATIPSNQQTLKVDAFNFEAVGSFRHGKWNLRYTPLQRLLDHATHPVYFVMGTQSQGKGSVATVKVIGPNTLHLKVGDSLSFVPLNQLAVKHLLGAMGNLGTFNGISVYTNGGGKEPLRFYQAAQVMTNTYDFSTTGVYQFGIVPPGYQGMTANSKAATLTVDVVKK